MYTGLEMYHWNEKIWEKAHYNAEGMPYPQV